MLLGQVHSLLGVSLGPSIRAASVHVEFPARFLPAVESGLLDKFQPLIHRHIAELPANQADLVVRSVAEPLRRGLVETHSNLTSLYSLSSRDILNTDGMDSIDSCITCHPGSLH